MKRIAETSPSPRARITGVVYLFYFLMTVSAQFFVGRFVVYDAANLIANMCYIVLTILFYYMFKPVNRRLSLLAALFSIAGCIIGILDLFHLAPSGISPLAFFGPYCIFLGYLIFRSGFLPRILGVLMVFAGLGWLTFMSPLAKYLSTYIMALGILAEGLLMVWLVLKGVNVQRWKERAGKT